MSGAIEVLKDNLKQVNKAYKNFGDYSSAGIVINKDLIIAIDEALLALEQKEKLKRIINSVLEYYECNPYNHKTGYKLGDEAREEVMETLNELLKELEGVSK